LNRHAALSVVLVALIAGIPISAAAFTLPQDPQELMAIAVLELEANNVEVGEVRAIAERLRVKLTEKRDTFEVVERNRMESILDEVGFQMSGACNTNECVVQVGQILGVQKMVAGSVSKVGNLYTLQVRIVDVATGRIEEVAYEDVAGIEQVLTDATGDVADKLAAAVSGQPEPARQEQAERGVDPIVPSDTNWRQNAHHDGWVMRFGSGPRGGTGSRTALVTGTEVTTDISGSGLGWELMIGRAIRPDFLWFFIASRTEIYGPDITVSNPGTTTTSKDSRLGIEYAGLGITIYLEPKNWWGSLAVVSTTYDFLNDEIGTETTSDSAAGVYLALGKDWWLWKRFNFGLTARLVYSENVSLLGLGVSFTLDVTRSR